MNRPYEELKIISCHLGNGASIAAVANGKCVDTSMGLTPLEGLRNGYPLWWYLTRPSLNLSWKERESVSKKWIKSWIKRAASWVDQGSATIPGDVSEAAKNGNKRAQLALELFDYRVVKYIGAYVAAMGGADAIVFTAGIGENQWETRDNIIEQLGFLGIKLIKRPIRSEVKKRRFLLQIQR